MSGFGTSTEEMQKAGQHVDDVNNQIQAELRNLQSSLEPLAGQWKGESAAAFQQLMTRWHEDADKLNKALQAIGQGIASAGKAYASQDQHGGGSMSHIGGVLG